MSVVPGNDPLEPSLSRERIAAIYQQHQIDPDLVNPILCKTCQTERMKLRGMDNRIGQSWGSWGEAYDCNEAKDADGDDNNRTFHNVEAVNAAPESFIQDPDTVISQIKNGQQYPQWYRGQPKNSHGIKYGSTRIKEILQNNASLLPRLVLMQLAMFHIYTVVILITFLE